MILNAEQTPSQNSKWLLKYTTRFVGCPILKFQRAGSCPATEKNIIKLIIFTLCLE